MSSASIRSFNAPMRSWSNQTLTVSVASRTGRRNISQNGPSFVPNKKRISFQRKVVAANPQNGTKAVSTTANLQKSFSGFSIGGAQIQAMKTGPKLEFDPSKKRFQYHRPLGQATSSSASPKKSILRPYQAPTDLIRLLHSSSKAGAPKK